MKMFNLYYKQIFYLKNKIINKFFKIEKKKKEKWIKMIISNYNKKIILLKIYKMIKIAKILKKTI
jgi:hypothetical protein